LFRLAGFRGKLRNCDVGARGRLELAQGGIKCTEDDFDSPSLCEKRVTVMIKDIIVNLAVGKARDVAGEFAISTAALFDAHVSAVAFAYEPPIGGSVFSGLSSSIVEGWRADRKAEADKARQAFDDGARRAGVAADSRVISELVAEVGPVFGALARNHDIAVLAQAKPDNDFAESRAIESALFDSGRPVLVVPYIQTAGIRLDRVVACWDGSRNAARAINDAMPLLQKAGRIDVVMVAHKDRRNDLRGVPITEHLARHGFNVELKSIVAPDSDAANVILSHAADSGADLIVMGGYGHTRLREFVLGGVTREMLNAMTAPVLMSH